MKILTTIGTDDCIIKTWQRPTGKDENGEPTSKRIAGKKYFYKHEVSELYFFRTIHNDHNEPVEIQKIHLSEDDISRIIEEVKKINDMPEFLDTDEDDLPF